MDTTVILGVPLDNLEDGPGDRVRRRGNDLLRGEDSFLFDLLPSFQRFHKLLLDFFHFHDLLLWGAAFLLQMSRMTVACHPRSSFETR